MAPPEGRHPGWRILADLAGRLRLDAIGRSAVPSEVTTDDILARVTRSANLEDMRALDEAPLMAERAVYNWAQARFPNGRWGASHRPRLRGNRFPSSWLCRSERKCPHSLRHH